MRAARQTVVTKTYDGDIDSGGGFWAVMQELAFVVALVAVGFILYSCS